MSNTGPDYKPTPLSTPAQTVPTGPPVPVEQSTLNTILEKLQTIDSKVDNTAEDIKDLKRRTARLEDRADDHDRRDDAHSTQGQLGSKVDEEHAAAIASIIAEQKAAKLRDETTQKLIAENTAVTEKVLALGANVFKHPAVQALIFAAIAFATVWLQRHS